MNLFQFEIKKGLVLFYDEQLGWYWEDVHGKSDSNDAKFYLILLPLLEGDYSSFIGHVSSKINNPEKALSLLLVPILMLPFENKSQYWAERSLDWIVQSFLKQNLIDWSRSIELTWMSQKLRHRFLKVFQIKSY